MVDIVSQLCIKSYEVTAKNGDHWKAQQGRVYTTSIPENGDVMVFSNYWVRIPADHFVLMEKSDEP